MEFFIFISILGIILLYFGARKREQEIAGLQEELKGLKRKIDFFQTKFDALEASVNKKSEVLRTTLPLLEELKVPEEIIPFPKSLSAVVPEKREQEETEEPRPVIDWNAVPPAMPPIRARVEAEEEERIPEPPQPSIFDKIDWEMFMGAKLFAWIGGLLLFIGVSFFVKYSLDHNLIPAELRAAICYGLGAGMIGGGLWLSKEKYSATVHTLCGTGVLVLYGITFACRAYYHFELFSPAVTMAWMVLITVVAFLIAIRLNAKTVAVMGILGGFLTPLLISTGENNPVGLFTYIALLDIGLLAVALVQGWGFIAILGVAGTFLLELGWADRYFSQSGLNTTLWISLGFNFLFGIASIIANRIGRLNERICWATGLTTLANYSFILTYYSHFQNHPATLFGLAFSASILLLGLSRVQEGMVRWFLIGGGFTFAVLLKWTVQKCGNLDELDPWALYRVLGLHFIFAILHTVVPLCFQTFRNLQRQGKWIIGFSMAALWLCLWIPFQATTISWVIWGVILLLNLVIAGCALVAGSVLAIFVAGISTLLGSGICIWMKPQAFMSDQLLPLLALVTGISVLFFGAGLFLSKQFRKRGDEEGADLLPIFSVFSATWPYLLLATLAGGIALPNPSTIFGVALLMNVLLLGLSRHFYSGWLPGVALAGTTLMQMAWSFRSFNEASISTPLLWTVGFHLLFVLFPFCFKRSFLKEAGAWIASALAGPIAFLFIYGMTENLIPESMGGALPVIFAVTSLIWLIAVIKGTPEEGSIRLTTLAWYGGIALLFITLIFPMQFNRHWLTVGWGMEGAALFWLFRRVRHPGLPGTGLTLLIVCFVRLLWNAVDSGCYVRSETVFMNAYLFDYIAVIGAVVGARQFLIMESESVFGLPTRRIFEVMGLTLLFVLMNLGINDAFGINGGSLALAYSHQTPMVVVRVLSMALFAWGLTRLSEKMGFKELQLVAFGIAIFSVLRLFASPWLCDPLIKQGIPFANWHFAGFGGLILILWILKKSWDESSECLKIPICKTIRILMALLLFVLMNLQIMDLFTKESHAVILTFSGSLAQDMTYTIAWTLFALGLVFFGLLKRIPYARYTGLALVGGSLLKLFFHDLVRLDQLYRIGAFIAVAVIMMLASFFYQKFVSSLDKKTEQL